MVCLMKKINMFFDSGLVVVGVVDGDIKQSWMCMTPENMKILGVLNPDSTSVTKITPTTHSISFAEIIMAMFCYRKASLSLNLGE